MLGTSVGAYEITAKLAEGGMGAVYAARHTMMGREAVVKVLLPQMSANQDIVNRFFNEARAAASIHHPGIVDVYDMGYVEGRAYLVMELLRGETLAARLASGPMQAGDAVSVTRQLAGALGAAHERSIVHRDLKPDNIYLVPDPEVFGGERVKIIDFGIAKLATVKGSMATVAGSVFGTPAYMAPEQCKDAATVDHRADLYAVGCILHEMLCGQPPFGQGGLELLAAHLRDEPPPLRSVKPDVPAHLERIALRLLAKDPDQRFGSCAELITSLESGDHRISAPMRAPSTAPTMSPKPPRITSPEALANTAQPAAAVPAAPSTPRVVQAHSTYSAASGERAPAEAEVATQSTGASSKMPILVGVALVLALVVGGTGVYVLTRPDHDDGDTSASARDTDPPDDQAPDDEREPEPPPSRFDELLGQAERALAERRWEDALLAAKQANDEMPGSPAAAELEERARSDMRTQLIFERLVAAADKKKIGVVANELAQIPETSFYRGEAVALFEGARDEWIAPYVKKANGYADHNRCSRITGVAKEVGKKLPTERGIIDAIKERCDAAAASKKDDDKKISDEKRPTPDKCIDEVACLLADTPPACCKTYGKHGPAYEPETDPNPGLPETLTRGDIKKGIGTIRGRVAACGDKHEGTGQVKVTIAVAGNGAVKSVILKSSPNAALGECVAQAVKNAKFPKTLTGASFTYPFVF